MIWPFKRKSTTETGAQYYLRDAAVADVRTLVDFKHRAWREIYAGINDETFFEQAEASTSEQVAFWKKQIDRGATVWIAEDLRDRMLGTIHATTTHSQLTEDLIAAHGLDDMQELRYFYLVTTAPAKLGAALIRQAVGDDPAVTWVSGIAPQVTASLELAGFQPLGDPVELTEPPWHGIRQQAMVRA